MTYTNYRFPYKLLSWQTSCCEKPVCSSGKEPACQCRRHKRCGFDLWVGKFPWRRVWQPLQYPCLENPHGQRSLADCSPWGHKESDSTEATKHPRIMHNTDWFPISIRSRLFSWKSSQCPSLLITTNECLKSLSLLFSQICLQIPASVPGAESGKQGAPREVSDALTLTLVHIPVSLVSGEMPA